MGCEGWCGDRVDIAIRYSEEGDPDPVDAVDDTSLIGPIIPSPQASIERSSRVPMSELMGQEMSLARILAGSAG